ncbi:hypothetical protein PY257_16335, partial [Ramlibacter sp. H39-3-26]|uniref:hypothetical protein n=1 Tax=Curvibacter soli TaxID=3031331 RepID=UPI0023D9F8A9
ASYAAAGNEAQERIAKMQRDNEMSEAIRLHRPLVGMTVAQLQEAMGPATKVNADISRTTTTFQAARI